MHSQHVKPGGGTNANSRPMKESGSNTSACVPSFLVFFM
jgi:hypothetical protein